MDGTDTGITDTIIMEIIIIMDIITTIGDMEEIPATADVQAELWETTE
jgi:hypothetical protein